MAAAGGACIFCLAAVVVAKHHHQPAQSVDTSDPDGDIPLDNVRGSKSGGNAKFMSFSGTVDEEAAYPEGEKGPPLRDGPNRGGSDDTELLLTI